MLRFSLRVWVANNRWFNTKNPDFACTSNRCHRTKRQRQIDEGNVQFLVKLLGVDRSVAIQIFTNYMGMKKISYHEMTRNYNICVKYGVADMVANELSHLLFYKPTIVEQRICFLKDVGCTRITELGIKLLNSHEPFTMGDLKSRLMLPDDVDVTKNLLNCLHEQPEDVPQFESLSDDVTFLEIQRKILRHYLAWRFQLTEEQLEKMCRVKLGIKYQSFSLLRKMLDMLESQLGFSREKIRKCPTLLGKSPTNTEWILNEIKYIGKVKTKDLLVMYPRLMHMQVDALQSKIKVLKYFDVADEAISTFPEIFSLAEKTITRRLFEYRNIAELKGHWRHPRILTIIFYMEQVKTRIDILKQLNVRCVSLHMLTTNKLSFQRYITVGSDRTKGRDMMRFLSYELQVDFKDARLLLIKRHSFWCQIPFLHVQETFTYLKEDNYSNEDILKNIQIVFYKSEQLRKELNKIDSSRLYESRELTPARKLALCLYNIEKIYHFDGNGVWNLRSNDNEELQCPQYFKHSSNR